MTAVSAFAILQMAVASADDEWIPQGFSAYVTVATDYIYRGISQTDGGETLQGNVDYQHETGIFAGAWASNVRFPTRRFRDKPREIQLDFYAGYTRSVTSDLQLSVSLARIMYPNSSVDYNYTEVAGSAVYRDELSFSVAHTRDWMGHGTPATDVAFTWQRQTVLELLPGATIAWFDSDDISGHGYAYWNLGVSRLFGNVLVDLRYHDSDDRAMRSFRNLADKRWVASLSIVL